MDDTTDRPEDGSGRGQRFMRLAAAVGDLGSPFHERPAAQVAVAGLVVAFVLGVAFSQQWPSDGFLGGFSDGLAIGGVLGGFAGVVGILWDLHRRRRPTASDR